MSETRSDILAWIGLNPTMAKIINAAAKLDRLPADHDVIRYAVVRNITLEPGLPAAIKVQSAETGLKAVVELGNFDAAQEEVFNPKSFLYVDRADIVVIALQLQTLSPMLVTGFSSLSPAEVEALADSTLDRVIGLVAGIRERSSSLILVHNFEAVLFPAFGILDAQMSHGQQNVIRLLNLELAKRVAGVSSSYVVDVSHLLAQMGHENALDDRYWHMGRAPYSFAFGQRLAQEYVKFAAALKGKNKKCLVLDCDNTLWGGVVGEDGLNGIALGASYPGSGFVAFQEAILNLYDRGILLAIASKNNHADAMEVFESHPDSLLRPHHFVATRINWQDKVTNLREIAAELNIGLDSLVFVDDNAFECQHIRESLPQVTVVELPPDASRYARLLRGLGLFDTLAISAEDRKRSEMYQSEARRSELKAGTGSMEDYLRSLDLVLTISGATPFSIPRIAQLTQKTNQFNLTTKRYAEDDIARMAADPAWRVYYAELEDKFGKAGIIAVALVNDVGPVSRIDTYLMSCRVIGRGVEQALLSHIAQESLLLGQETLVGEYIASQKNSLVTDFYRGAGFTERPASDSRWWDVTLRESVPPLPNWFREIRSSSSGKVEV